jgi:hypothetical protein
VISLADEWWKYDREGGDEWNLEKAWVLFALLLVALLILGLVMTPGA